MKNSHSLVYKDSYGDGSPAQYEFRKNKSILGLNHMHQSLQKNVYLNQRMQVAHDQKRSRLFQQKLQQRLNDARSCAKNDRSEINRASHSLQSLESRTNAGSVMGSVTKQGLKGQVLKYRLVRHNGQQRYQRVSPV